MKTPKYKFNTDLLPLNMFTVSPSFLSLQLPSPLSQAFSQLFQPPSHSRMERCCCRQNSFCLLLHLVPPVCGQPSVPGSGLVWDLDWSASACALCTTARHLGLQTPDQPDQDRPRSGSYPEYMGLQCRLYTVQDEGDTPVDIME